EWMVNQITPIRGNAEIVAYFLVRAADLLKPAGSLGLLTAVALSEGGTRKAGLAVLMHSGFSLTRALSSRTWPAKSALPAFAAVWWSFARVEGDVLRHVDGVAVPRMSANVEAGGRVEGNPAARWANKGKAFVGCYLNGKGVQTPEESARMMQGADIR